MVDEVVYRDVVLLRSVLSIDRVSLCLGVGTVVLWG